MEKILIMEKLKFVSSTCRLLQIKLNEDLNQETGTLPQFIIDECMGVMQEIKQKADYWLDRANHDDTIVPYDLPAACCYVFDRFNKVIAILFPQERMEL